MVCIASLAVLGLTSGCRHENAVPDRIIENGDADRGRTEIARYGCGGCHMIPGINGANGMIGPPLIHWAQRRIIAGEVENTPEHLITWLTMPQAIEPGTAMPNMGITDGQARDIATYLYSIR